MSRVLRDFPSFTSRFFINEQIDEDLIRKIIKFSENKINANGVKLFHDVGQILALAKMCGFVSVLLINGRVCAGLVSYQIDSNYFGAITGYDPQYGKHGVGKICFHLTICESILRGGAKYDLGGGLFAYKQRMLAQTCSMDELNIYRSYGKMLVNFDMVAKAAAAGYVSLLKKVLHKNRQKAWAKCVFECFYFFRNKLAK
jgi:CelD/BcsL family acetyltransferase involved in cellulose biosynthesis